MKNKLLVVILATILLTTAGFAQTTAFTFQGKLSDGAIAANGTYQFQFRLYDAAVGNAQIGQTIADIPTTATNGIFAVNLDFGAASFDGAARFIEVGVRLNGSGQPYTILSPRQMVASTPYSVKSLKSNEATTAVTANNSLNLGGVLASEYVQTTDTRMSDDRNPLANSGFYIQNGTSLQTTSNFNVSGEGRASILNAVTQYNLNGVRILSGSLGNGNFIAGFEAGINNTSLGDGSTFVGVRAGKLNTNGASNSFFGYQSGLNNTTGAFNAFFGSQTGAANLTGNDNSFFGQFAGFNNTTGARNTLVGSAAAQFNTTGSNNTFVGFLAGFSNTTESNNTFIGYNANGAVGITNATAIGANSIVTTSDTMVLGTNVVTVQVPGSLNIAGTFSANVLNSATVYKINNNRVFHLTGTDNTFVGVDSGNSMTTGKINAFFGKEAGKNTTDGINNTFAGAFAGRANVTGDNNAFFGANAGLSSVANGNSFFGSNAGFSTTTGNENAFFGASGGLNNTTGKSNAFFGFEAGKANLGAEQNAFFGARAGKSNFGSSNTFFGALAGEDNTSGIQNIFLGAQTGSTNTTGSENVFIGAGFGNTTGNQNTLIGNLGGGSFDNQYRNLTLGYNARVGAIHDAAAIGVDSFANNLFSMVLGTNQTTVIVPGGLVNFSSSATRIDHPLDPLNQYLTQTSITSPDMMNVYNGNIETDENGEAIVTMPAYLETLNRDFRYQLTVIGQFAQAIVGEEIKGNQFRIRTDKPNVKVSWQVTGIRQDAVANQNRVVTESVKPANELGTYLNPAAFNKPELLERRKETKSDTTVVPNK